MKLVLGSQQFMFPSRYSYFIFIYCCFIHLLVVHLFIHVFKVSFELEMLPQMSIVHISGSMSSSKLALKFFWLEACPAACSHRMMLQPVGKKLKRGTMPQSAPWPGGHRAEQEDGGLRGLVVTRPRPIRSQEEISRTLIELRRKKKAIGQQKRQLDLEEDQVDEEIASLEDQFHLAMQKETAEEDVTTVGRWTDQPEADQPIIHAVRDSEEENMDERQRTWVEAGEDSSWKMFQHNFVQARFKVKREEDEDMDEHLEAGASDMNEHFRSWNTWMNTSDMNKKMDVWTGSCDVAEDVWWARKWMEKGGDDISIPKPYTPCVYFFKAGHGCQSNKCQFSHNEEIFRKEPLAAFIQNLSWGKKNGKRFTRLVEP